MTHLTETQQRNITKLKRELGKEIIAALENPNVIEIMLNSDGYLWTEEFGKGMQRICKFPETSSRPAIYTIATFIDTTITPDNPILECELPIDGSRFEGLIPPVVSKPTFTIRKKAIKVFTLEDYLENKIITQNQKDIIEQAIADKQNILIVGGTGSGKTTLTNAIIQKISQITPDDRIVIIEDTAEIQCEQENKVILRSTKNTTMTTLLKATMRLRPDRILVGETRGPEALDLLKAWNTGHPGGLATIHANSAYAGLTRMQQLISEATIAPMQELIADAINMVIFIKKTKNRSRKVDEIIEVINYDINQQKYNTKKIL